LVTKADFQNESTLNKLRSTLNYLLDANIVPILNTNDAIAHPECQDLPGSVNINDNDSLAARLATMLDSDLLLLMSDVEGVYTRPPSEAGSRLLHTVSVKSESSVSFGDKSNVGTGGMESKISAARFAVQNHCSTIICNGKKPNAIIDCVKGKKVGTFFNNEAQAFSIESLAMNGNKKAMNS
jgi:delta-1-pyrroline-5-carboxylate synthetase